MISIRSAVISRVLLLILAVATPAYADDMDLLIGKLVSKGILTQTDADEIRAEMIRETAGAKPSLTEQDMAVAPTARPPKANDSGWWDRMSLQGDMRVRRQIEDLDNLPAVGGLDIDQQDRWRIRWRAGMTADVNEQWQVGFGLASGGADGRSTNETLRGAFSTGDARLDYAYARYDVNEHVDALAGRFKNPLWQPKDLLWDSDLRPEGIAVPMQFTLGDGIQAFLTPAYLVLSEDVKGSRDDAAMWVVQAGATFALSESAALKLAPAYYSFSGLKGSSGPVSVDIPSNSRDADGNFRYDYDALALGAELTLGGTQVVPSVVVFGEWVNAFDPSNDETGWLLGFSLGDSKVKDFGDWQFSYNYRRLEADAWPEFLSDSDFFFGATNVKGSELEFQWALAKGVNVSLDYYSGAELLGTDIQQDLLQIDLNIKW